MLANLYLYNLPAQIELSDYSDLDGNFVLATCQRTMVLSQGTKIDSLDEFTPFNDKDAYQFLLEVICGMKSRLIGENEIVSQFKKAYQSYVQGSEKNTELLLILEKLFRDAKSIRSEYLTGISQKTYASLTRKEFVQKQRAQEIVILGSGQLAQDLINQFVKHCKITVCARNIEKIAELQNIERCNILEWDELSSLKDHPYIANTIGFKGELLGPDFFDVWASQHENKLFIDLGSPSCINTDLKTDDGVLRLDDIFNEGAIHEENKREKLEQAQSAIKDLVVKRKAYLRDKHLKKRSSAPHGEEQTANI
ncbi:MAG: hypothetical protein VYA54_00055 [Bdellovibrionota bacterium]|nr:hypothetical protein [Bdellovibrionota bacterium]